MARKQSSEKPLVVSSGAAAAPARRKTTTTKRTVPSNVVVVEVETVSAAITAPGADEIAALAYSFWEARGYQGGSPEADWLRAEQQLSALSAK